MKPIRIAGSLVLVAALIAGCSERNAITSPPAEAMRLPTVAHSSSLYFALPLPAL